MAERRGRSRDLCNGPGRLTQALGIDLAYDGHVLTSGNLTIAEGKRPDGIVETTRIGISRGTDLPWRYSPVPAASDPTGDVARRGAARRR